MESSLSETKHKFALPENPDIVFEQDQSTREVEMLVCGESLGKKRVPDFTLKTVRRIFGREIAEHKREICPTNMDERTPKGEF
jgi:hypothetical protein